MKNQQYMPLLNAIRTPDTPTFKRQKFLLSFIRSAGGSLSYMDFQKLLFLYLQRVHESYYDFVPYLYGCYSFQAAQDIDTLSSMGWLEKKDNLFCLSNSHIPDEGCSIQLDLFHDEYRNIRGDALIRQVYREFPYFAIHRKIANSLMSMEEHEAIKKEKEGLKKDEAIVFTIGYEGLSLERYINMLIQNNICVLCDVRNNPISRKFGFSKPLLSRVLPKIGIEYIHIPELGIISSKRKDLDDDADYKALFSEYKKELPQKNYSIDVLLSIYENKRRLALTCFEHDALHCHRHVISDYLAKNYHIKVYHI